MHPPLLLLLQVTCTPPLAPCPDQGDGLTCPFVNGQCIDASASGDLSSLDSLSGSSTTPSSTSSSSSSSSSSPGSSYLNAAIAAAAAADNPDAGLVPVLLLNGDPSSTVSKGAVYAPCPGTRVSGCELGATATLKAAGDLNPSVVACGAGVANPKAFKTVGLQYCGIDTSQPGTYTITYTLTYNSQSLSVSRQLVVQDICQAGEALCKGQCIASDELCDTASTSSGSGSNGASASGTQPALATVVNTPPVIELVTTAQFGSSIQVCVCVCVRVCVHACVCACVRACDSVFLLLLLTHAHTHTCTLPPPPSLP